jgi:tetrahydromethanopterin S-methyltransferase subunit F
MDLVVVLNTVEQVAGVVLWLVLALLTMGVVIGVPAYIGYIAYDTVRDKEVYNPAALGFAAGFFSLVVIVVIILLVLVYGF